MLQPNWAGLHEQEERLVLTRQWASYAQHSWVLEQGGRACWRAGVKHQCVCEAPPSLVSQVGLMCCRRGGKRSCGEVKK